MYIHMIIIHTHTYAYVITCNTQYIYTHIYTHTYFQMIHIHTQIYIFTKIIHVTWEGGNLKVQMTGTHICISIIICTCTYISAIPCLLLYTYIHVEHTYIFHSACTHNHTFHFNYLIVGEVEVALPICTGDQPQSPVKFSSTKYFTLVSTCQSLTLTSLA